MLVETPKNYIYRPGRGDYLELRCHANTDRFLHTVWYHNGRRIRVLPQKIRLRPGQWWDIPPWMKYVLSEGVLTVSSRRLDTSGTYRCEIRTTRQTLTAESHIVLLPDGKYFHTLLFLSFCFFLTEISCHFAVVLEREVCS